jgi:hypothetical protein
MTEPLVVELKAELTHIEREMCTLSNRKEAVMRLLEMYAVPGKPSLENGERLTTVAMAEKVLDEHGKAAGATEISRLIRDRFGVKPAPSLQQILYNHAKRQDRFCSEGDGKYGLLKWRTRKEK